MTRDFKRVLQILGAAINNVHTEWTQQYNIKLIKKAAASQGVWTLVYPELEKYTDTSEYLPEFMQMVTIGIKRTTFQLHMISELNNAGFKVCLLKGAAVAALYPHPEYRISGDTDILIKLEEEKEIIKFLEQNGYTVEKREKNDHHFKAYHPVGGLLEGHIRLYSIPTEKIILDGLELYNEEFSEMEIEGYTVPVLGLNDGLVYLTAHYIKHLVNEGGGIRQILDLFIYIEHYKNELDFERYYSVMKQLRYYKLIEVVQTIGAKYWGFDYPIKYEDLAEEILTDSEEGGIFGFDTDSRRGFYNIYCKKRSENSLKSKALKAVKKEAGLKNRFFPSQSILLRNEEYKYAKNKILLPIAWTHRLFRAVMKRTVKNKKSDGVEKRLKLMRELNMIN